MSLTNLAQVTDQIQKYWSPRFTKELRESLLLGSLVSKEYDGEIKQGGDTVRVSQVQAPAGELLDVGVNADSFNSELLQTVKVDIVANKRAVASYKFADLVDIQSMIDKNNPEVMDALRFALAKQVNDYLYSLAIPSASAPDHIINSVSSFSATTLGTLRTNAGVAKWPQDGQWFGLMGSGYYVDMLGVTALTSTDFGANDTPVISGQQALPRYGFKMLEDNSRASQYALFFHPSFMNYVSQSSVSVKISDRHALGEFGYIMSVDLIFGAQLAYDGAVRCQKVIST
jgi:hypothetical protein